MTHRWVPKRPCTAPGCDGMVYGWNLCSKHHYRMKRHGKIQLDRVEPGSAPRWLVEHVSHTGEECLFWPFSRRGDRYGQVSWDGNLEYAHRVMCRLKNGPAPFDKPLALHSCGKGENGCVNPMHLYWGDHKDNSNDRIKHGNSMRGDKNPQCRLSAQTISEIKSLKGTMTETKAGELMGVSRSYVNALWNNKKRRHG